MTSKDSLYIYALIPNSSPYSLSGSGIGGKEDDIFTIDYRDIQAVVSHSRIDEYEANRTNTLTHQRAIEDVMRQYPVLPMQFATVVDGQDALTDFLEKHYDEIVKQLDWISDKVELGLKVLVRQDEVFAQIVQHSEKIRSMKEKVEKMPFEKSYYERIEIGRLVAEELEKEKNRYKDRFLELLTPLSVDVKENKCFGDKMILNGSFLVRKSEEEAFDQAVNDLDDELSDHLITKYVGYLPPYNFVHLHL